MFIWRCIQQILPILNSVDSS